MPKTYTAVVSIKFDLRDWTLGPEWDRNYIVLHLPVVSITITWS